MFLPVPLCGARAPVYHRPMISEHDAGSLIPPEEFPALSGERLDALCRLAETIEVNGGDRGAPIRHMCALLGDRWTKLILLVLNAAAPLRYSELQRLIWRLGKDERPISQRMLTLRLRSLERDGLVDRTVQCVMPPHVEYSLSPLGQRLNAQSDRLINWIAEHQEEFIAARRELPQD